MAVRVGRGPEEVKDLASSVFRTKFDLSTGPRRSIHFLAHSFLHCIEGSDPETLGRFPNSGRSGGLAVILFKSKIALVIEDDSKILKLVGRYCEQLGMAVREAPSAKTAAALLQQFTPDLVCLDLVLPESSGYTICEQMRATPRLANVPVLVISARSSLLDRAAAEEAGADDYLVKPLRWAAFALAAGRLLACSEVQAT